MNNEALREFLPYLRPRPSEPILGLKLTVAVILLSLVALAVLAVVRWLRAREHRRQQFLLQAEELGLEPAQAAFLLQVARRQRLRHPELLLTSLYVFERRVGDYADRVAAESPSDPQLEEISRIRVALGFHRLAADQPLQSTRHVELGQTLMVWRSDSEVHWPTPWLVVQRNERSMTIVPLLRDDQRHFLSVRAGDPLSVRFWRERDTEYRFATRVLEVDLEQQGLVLAHTAHVERLQQREFFRLEVGFPILLYAVPEAQADRLPGPGRGPRPPAGQEEDGEAELPAVDLATAPCLIGRAVNLSAGGLGVVTRDQVPSEHVFFIDPDFVGDFPLAGLVCELLHQTRSPEGNQLQLRFVDLPPELEKAIVRRVFAAQTGLSEGSRQAPAAAAPTPEVPPFGEADPPSGS